MPQYIYFGALDCPPNRDPFRNGKLSQPARDAYAVEAQANGWETVCLLEIKGTTIRDLKIQLQRLYDFRDSLLDSYADNSTTWLLNDPMGTGRGGHWVVLGLSDNDAVKLKMLW